MCCGLKSNLQCGWPEPLEPGGSVNAMCGDVWGQRVRGQETLFRQAKGSEADDPSRLSQAGSVWRVCDCSIQGISKL